MDVTTLVLVGVAIVFGALWMMRRRSRMRSDKFD
jgi:hypothetical protein